MQTKKLFQLMLLVAATAFFASCGKSNKQGKLIPKNAAIVLKMDGKSLLAKLPWEEIKQNPFFQQAYADSNLSASVKSLLDNPENAGIDPASDFIFFMIRDTMGGYLAFEGTVKDEAKFKAFNQQMSNGGTESEKDGVQFISKSPVCVGWTKERFIYVIDAPQMSQMDELSRRMMRDSIDITSPTNRDIGATCKAIFDLKESNTLAKEEKFSTLMDEKGDMHFWMNAEEMNKSAATSSAFTMLNLDNFLKGNVTTGTLDFENGKMLVNARMYAGEKMTDLFKKYSGGKINEDMIKRIPGKDIVAIMALNFKPEGIRELIKLTNMDGLVNMGLNSMGFTIDDFIKANKGDIVFGVTDLSLKADTTTFNFEEQPENKIVKQKADFNYIFSAAIGDKDAFNKLINAGKKIGQASFSDSSKVPVAYNSNGTYFALGNTRENVDKFLAGANSSFDFINKINGEPFGGYFNIQAILNSFATEIGKDSTSKVVMTESLKMWDNVMWKGGNYKDGAITQTAEINLVDKSTNSLKQLNQYAAKMGALLKEKHRKDKEEMTAFENSIIPDTTVNQSKSGEKK